MSLKRRLERLEVARAVGELFWLSDAQLARCIRDAWAEVMERDELDDDLAEMLRATARAYSITVPEGEPAEATWPRLRAVLAGA